MTFQLPKLKYEYDALEPHIDESTMKIHHTKHHQAYTDKFNAALEKHPKLFEKTAEEIISDISKIPEDIRTAVINNGGGYLNHAFFWEILKKDVKLSGEIEKAISNKFGSFETFKEEFSNSAITVFGSGWAWLVLNEKKELEIIQTKNQDSPLSIKKMPLIGIDLWEHAYYLKYQNRRPEYVGAFFNIINWEKVNKLFLHYKK